ncbi:hypothetical protein TWF481_010580 [Arthrobotrys musiformis]|uniref:C3H1-type domain-containing protein n=1 Tax=Arthrobotrys musiformis TaxID=47236 RepID=A0AAV9W174_9PEZI
MTRQMRGAAHPMAKLRSEITVPVDSQLYAFCSRMKQTPVRSMLMAHGCCFDFFEKGICMAGNDCKYSHLNPGDERNLVMDSEAGLRRKKYYRPETLETYRPGSQDIICFTFARKGWCIHGDKCWNQHISPPGELLQELGSKTFNGLPFSNTPSPDQDDMPTFLDTGRGSGLGVTQPMAHRNFPAKNPSPIAVTNPHWSSTTLAPIQSGQRSGQHLGQYPGQYSGQYPGQHSGDFNRNKQSNEQYLPRAQTQNKGTYFCNPDPQRTAAPNWRVPNTSAGVSTGTPSPVPQALPAIKAAPAPVIPGPVVTAPIIRAPIVRAPTIQAATIQAPMVSAPVVLAPIAKPIQAPVVRSAPAQAAAARTPPATVRQQPIRSALNEFNWRPVIQEQPTSWRRGNNPTAITTSGISRPVLPPLQIPDRGGVPLNPQVNYSIGLSDDGHYDRRKYRLGGFGLGHAQSTKPGKWGLKGP